MNDTLKFFLGANSDRGFMSYFKQLQEHSSMQLLILKGGPGSGKSSLMKRVADYAEKKGHTIISVPCASDPESIDAFIDVTASFSMIDGTAPHTEDPGIPGVKHHIIYTGEMWDTEKLRNKGEEIEFFSNLTSDLHSGAAAYIRSAGALLKENVRLSEKYVLDDAQNFAADIMKDFPSSDNYRETKILLSAVTVGEIRFLEESLQKMADSIYVIEDEWGGAANVIFDTVRRIARVKRMSVVVCPCSVIPEKTDHIILPEAKVAFSLGNRFFKNSSGEKVNTEKFYRRGLDIALCEKRCHDARKLLGGASTLVKAAKKSHDRLEKFYVSAMDFGLMDGLFEKIIKEFYQ